MSSAEPIPFVDLKSQYTALKTDMDAALAHVVENAAFIGGHEVDRFERDFASFCGSRHAVGVSSGTSALEMIFRALGVGAGDEVVVPVHTFIASAEAVSLTGAKVVFADVDPETSLLDPAKLPLSANTKAVLAVHLFGRLAPMAALEAAIGQRQQRSIALIEDAAQAHGAGTPGERAGSLAQAAAFSFYPGKNLGAYGDAGAVTCRDEALADRVRRLSNHGRTEKYLHELVGTNARLDGMQAAVLNVKLPHLLEWTAARRRAAARYREMIAPLNGVAVSAPERDSDHVYHLFVIRVPERDALLERFKSHGIAAGVHYPIPLHLQPAYRELGHGPGDFPAAESFCRDTISLPIFPEITEAQQTRVVEILRQHVEAGA